MKLTIGFAVFSDFDGAWFTTMGLRLYHDLRDCEFVVVDNKPDGVQGKAVAHSLRRITEVPTRYIPFTASVGTAAPRDLIFREAKGEFVLCLDPHVLLRHRALDALREYFDRNPESNDLISGPLHMDEMIRPVTHFADQWRSHMWGTWAIAWEDADGRLFDVRTSADGLTDCRYLDTGRTDAGLPLIQFGGHEKQLEYMGYRMAVNERAEFEIPAMGLGLFAMRKAAWPGFNPGFKGFGGEECYIHEKVRKAGGRAVCLSALQWVHRFGRPGGVPYPLSLFDRARNYVLGHRELGLPLDRVYRNLVKGENEDGSPQGGLGKVSQVEWDAILSGADAPPAEPTCKPCEKGKAKNLEEWYEKAKSMPSDINEHVPTLRELAAQCDHVTEFSTAHTSTVALLHGRPQRFVTYDTRKSGEVERLKTMAGETAFEFRIGDSRTVEIEPTEMLFIDTVHNAPHLSAELERHHAKVSRWIVLHDTVSFGENGEQTDPTKPPLPGLRWAVRSFLKNHSEWVVIRDDVNNNGLMVLSKDDRDKKIPPSTWKQAATFTKAIAGWMGSGFKMAPEAERDKRMELCLICPSRFHDQCGECGCYIAKKVSLESEKCPLKKW